MTPSEKIKRIATIDREKINSIVGEIFIEKNKEIIHGIKGQLWDGKTGEGKDITPSYLDDPYFATKEKALAYAKWKASITKNSNRNFATPNLYINGFFHSSLFIDNSFRVASNGFGNPIIEKYGEKTFTLDKDRSENLEIINDIQQSLIEKIKEII